MKPSDKIIITAAVVAVAAFTAYCLHLQARLDRVRKANDEAQKSYAESAREIDILLGDKNRDPSMAPIGYSPAGPRPVLTTCIVCSGKVSSDAEKCPHCGDPR